jgi:hypothetical protein
MVSMIALAIAAKIVAFDNDTPTLAVDPVTKAPVVKDGKLVYTVGGKEELIDPNEVFSARSRVTALNGEAMGHRKEKETLAEKLKAFEGLDPAAAREAFDKLSKIDQKKLIDAGEVDKVRAEISQSFKGQLDTTAAERDAARVELNSLRMSNAFDRSKFVKERLAIPVDIAERSFAQYFTIGADGKLTAKGPDGNVIYSRDPQKSGVHADFEEAIEILVMGYPNRDAILKGDNKNGSGNGGGGGNTPPGVKVFTRAQWEALPPAEQAANSKLMREGKVKVEG